MTPPPLPERVGRGVWEGRRVGVRGGGGTVGVEAGEAVGRSVLVEVGTGERVGSGEEFWGAEHPNRKEREMRISEI